MSVLARKKKQQIELVVIVALIIGQLIFLITLFKGASIKADKTELTQLSAKVRDAQQILARKEPIRANLSKTLEELKALRIHVPPAVDPYAWAYEYVSSRASACGIHLDTVNEEISKTQPDAKKSKEKSASYYSVRLSMMCSYDQAIRFLRRLEDDNPLLLVSELKIESVVQEIMSHKTTLLLRWPSDFVIDQGGTQ